MRKLFLLLAFLSYSFPLGAYYTLTKESPTCLQIDHLYGHFTITDPLIIELLEHPMMERIKHIHQYGINYPVFISYDYSRFDHCLGVCLLLTKFGAPHAEVIAGLLHDASHTIGSHVAEKLFNHRSLDSSYQDDIHEWYLHAWDIDKIVAPYGLTVTDILAKNPAFTALDQPNGQICADRLDYNLIGGFKEGMLTKEDIAQILADLHFEHDQWYFTDATLATKFAMVSLYHTEHIWGSAANNVLYDWFAKALTQALSIGLITFEDIHFGTDEAIINRLTESDDPTIHKYMNYLRTYKTHFYLSTPSRADTIMYSKFRGINPWVLSADTLQPLTALNPQFARCYTAAQEQLAQGWYIGFVD